MRLGNPTIRPPPPSPPPPSVILGLGRRRRSMATPYQMLVSTELTALASLCSRRTQAVPVVTLSSSLGTIGRVGEHTATFPVRTAPTIPSPTPRHNSKTIHISFFPSDVAQTPHFPSIADSTTHTLVSPINSPRSLKITGSFPSHFGSTMWACRTGFRARHPNALPEVNSNRPLCMPSDIWALL